MSLAAAGRMRMEMCSSLVCLDSHCEYQMSGRVYHNCFIKSYESEHPAPYNRIIPESHNKLFPENRYKNYPIGKSFRNLIELIDILEEVYNEMDYPQSSMEFRSFKEKRGEEAEAKSLKVEHEITNRNSEERGTIATFYLRVMFRQNASWQGTINWIEEGIIENFRSVLELMRLIESAVPEDNMINLKPTQDNTQNKTSGSLQAM